jgi:hypothetical protein
MADIIPSARQAVVEAAPNGTQQFTVPWYRFFNALSQSNQAPSAATVGASPFSYTAPQAGVVLISGGTVSLVEYGRGGVFTNIGTVAGAVPVSQGDVVRVTYTVAPTMTFVRR